METKLIFKTDIIDYINQNGETFDNMLLSEAINVSRKIKEILDRGNIDLLKNERKLIFYVVELNRMIQN